MINLSTQKKIIKAYIEKPPTKINAPSLSSVEIFINQLNIEELCEINSLAYLAGQKQESIPMVMAICLASIILAILTGNTCRKTLTFFPVENKHANVASFLTGVAMMHLSFYLLKPYAEAMIETPREFSARKERSEKIQRIVCERLEQITLQTRARVQGYI